MAITCRSGNGRRGPGYIGQMATNDYFSTDFDEARDKFFAACRTQNLRPVEIMGHGTFGGAAPLVDIVRLGDRAARRILVIGGGDRLADALVCSAVQVGWLREFGGAALPPDIAVVLLHHGGAPRTGGEAPAGARIPPQWNSDLLTKVEERYAAYAREKGVDHMGAPLEEAADGNGDAPGYTGDVLDAVAGHLGGIAVGRLTFLDVWIGLGPYGEAGIVGCHEPGTVASDRIRVAFSLPPQIEDEPVAQGSPASMTAGLMRRFPGVDLTAVRLEFGTYSMLSVLDILSSRNPDRSLPDTRRLRNPDSVDWRESVWRGAIMNIQRALAGLHSG